MLVLGVMLPAPAQSATSARQFVPLVRSNQLTPVSKGIASQPATSSSRRFIPLNSGVRSASKHAMIPLSGGSGAKTISLKPLSSVNRVEKKTIADVSDEVKLAMAMGNADQEKVSAALAPLVKGAEFATAPVAAAAEPQAQDEFESASIPDEELETDMELPQAAMLGVTEDKPTKAQGKATGFVWPIEGDEYTRISSAFGSRRHPVTGKQDFHAGIDIPAPVGTKVLAALDGEVTGVGQHPRLGRYVKITHDDGSYSLYGHLSRYTAKQGARVAAGEVVGMVGSTGRSTGPHLDFSLRRNGKPVNPMPLLAKALEEKKLALAD